MAVLTSPMSGKVIRINAKVGDKVTADDEVLVLESMKMEIPVCFEDDATVEEILVQEGADVNSGTPLIRY